VTQRFKKLAQKAKISTPKFNLSAQNIHYIKLLLKPEKKFLEQKVANNATIYLACVNFPKNHNEFPKVAQWAA
jgi:predicted nucleotidyltransferase